MPHYLFDRTRASEYSFTSIGRRTITKNVVFTHTGVRNIFNMGFGDVLLDGSINDKANSNNGDIVKVLATIVHIMIDFTSELPDMEIFFTGSTPERTRLYTRILNTYYATFSKEFIIKGLIFDKSDYIEAPFKPNSGLKYLGFIIKKIY